jgi:hypothetical protein
LVEDKNFIDLCAVCKQGVSKLDMVYKKGRVFHPQCFVNYGSTFPTPDTDLTSLNARTRIELVQLKNLKVRKERGILQPPTIQKAKKPTKKTHAKKGKTKTKSRKPKMLKAKKTRPGKNKSKKVKKRR